MIKFDQTSYEIRCLGNRVVKENPKHKIKEVYVRDANGNVIAIYE
jgi:hypothetical protein